MLKVKDFIEDERCYEKVRELRWPEGVQCAHCGSNHVVKNGHHENQRARQRYRCNACKQRFDDLTNTIFASRHQPLKVWIMTLYLMGLNLSNSQIAKELDLSVSSVQEMTLQLRKGIVDKQPEPSLGVVQNKVTISPF